MGRTAKPWMREDNGKWYVHRGGRQIKLMVDGRHVTGKGSKADAEKAFHRLKVEWETAGDRKPELSLAVLANAFLEHSERHHTPRVAYLCQRYVKQFVEVVGRDTPALSLRPYHVSRWIDNPKWAANTRAHASGMIAQLFSWATREGHIDVNPIARFRKPGEVRRAAVMTAEQGNAAIEACKSPEFRDVLIALRGTGCRPGEVYGLTADRIDLGSGTWKVVDKVRKTTGQKYRLVYLSPEMVELSRRKLGQHPDGLVFRTRTGKAWHNVSAWEHMQKIKNALGYGAECVPYAYRHIYITDALERGIPPTTVAELVGHRNLTMIMAIYSRIGDRVEHLRQAASQVRERTAEAPRPVPPAAPTEAARPAATVRRKPTRPKLSGRPRRPQRPRRT